MYTLNLQNVVEEAGKYAIQKHIHCFDTYSCVDMLCKMSTGGYHMVYAADQLPAICEALKVYVAMKRLLLSAIETTSVKRGSEGRQIVIAHDALLLYEYTRGRENET